MRLNNSDSSALERKVQKPNRRATVNLSIYSRPLRNYRAESRQETRVNSGSEIVASVALPFFGKLLFDSPQKIARFVKVVRNGTRQSFGKVRKNGACASLIPDERAARRSKAQGYLCATESVFYAIARQTGDLTIVCVQNESAALLRNSENIGNACRENQLHYWIFIDFSGLSQWSEID